MADENDEMNGSNGADGAMNDSNGTDGAMNGSNGDSGAASAGAQNGAGADKATGTGATAAAMVNLPKENIAPTMIVEEMRRSYLDYAMSVIVSRALPDVRDGLKPVAPPHYLRRVRKRL